MSTLLPMYLPPLYLPPLYLYTRIYTLLYSVHSAVYSLVYQSILAHMHYSPPRPGILSAGSPSLPFSLFKHAEQRRQTVDRQRQCTEYRQRTVDRWYERKHGCRCFILRNLVFHFSTTAAAAAAAAPIYIIHFSEYILYSILFFCKLSQYTEYTQRNCTE